MYKVEITAQSNEGEEIEVYEHTINRKDYLKVDDNFLTLEDDEGNIHAYKVDTIYHYHITEIE